MHWSVLGSGVDLYSMAIPRGIYVGCSCQSTCLAGFQIHPISGFNLGQGEVKCVWVGFAH